MERHVEAVARAVERFQWPQWTDDEFDIWWEKDPFFTRQVTSWGCFTGTRKEKRLHEARLAIAAVATLCEPVSRMAETADMGRSIDPSRQPPSRDDTRGSDPEI